MQHSQLSWRIVSKCVNKWFLSLWSDSFPWAFICASSLMCSLVSAKAQTIREKKMFWLKIWTFADVNVIWCQSNNGRVHERCYVFKLRWETKTRGDEFSLNLSLSATEAWVIRATLLGIEPATSSKLGKSLMLHSFLQVLRLHWLLLLSGFVGWNLWEFL